VHLRIDDRLQVDEACRTALVRCVQEIVTNTIRHADAANLWIDVARAEDGQVVLTARDDGRGVRHLAHGNGLTGIRERVEGLGGSVRFSGHRGFEVVAKVPLP
jgi:signal transduction histidine kinase